MSSNRQRSTRNQVQVDRQSVAENEQRLLAEAEALLSSMAAFVGQTRKDLDSLRNRLKQAAKAPGAAILHSLGDAPRPLMDGAAGVLRYIEESGFGMFEENVHELVAEGGVLRAAVAFHADSDLDAFASRYESDHRSEDAQKVVASYAAVLMATLPHQPAGQEERPDSAN